MADLTLEMSDVEIRDEIVAAGEDPDRIVARMRRDFETHLTKAKGET